MKILMIGNGFDLEHELPTKYTQFLEFVTRFKYAYLSANSVPKRLYDIKDDYLKTIFENPEYEDRVVALHTFTENNVWINYFQKVYKKHLANKENWIDFENEISKVIQSLDQDMFFKDGEKSELSEKMQDLSNPFLHKKYSKYTAAMRTASALTHGKGESITYKEIRDRLYNDLNKLIRALEIYLTDYVEKEECNCVLPDIQEIVKENVKGADGEEQIKYCKVLSFNYTNTYERLYLDKQQIQNSIDYIHGKAKLFNTVENNNMVLGIDEYLTDERKDRETEFIAFKKFYQRIYKETGCKYKDWVETIREEYDDFLQETGLQGGGREQANRTHAGSDQFRL